MDIGVCVTGARFISQNQELIVRSSIRNLMKDIINKNHRTFSHIQFHVGDAKGVDTVARIYAKFCAQNNIWLKVTDHIVKDPKNKSSYAQRSIGMVDKCNESGTVGKNIIIGFPNKPCPQQVTPKNPFCGSGSGTWATLAYAKSKGLIIEIVPLFNKIPVPNWLLDDAVIAR
jgi:hypothetical protein